MASVSFMKLHSSAEFCRIVRHCDKYMREQDGHRNCDIDKRLTAKNTQLPKCGYKTVRKNYTRKLEALDQLPGANKRTGRVTCFSLEIPAPLNLRPSDQPEWFNRVYTIICEQYDYRNVLQYYVHYDEVHDYLHAESGRSFTSRVHAHCLVMPVHDGHLNGKWFSSRANMIKLNNSIHNMTLMEYGLEFMDGSKKGSTKRVEQLKRESDIVAFEKKIKEQEDQIKALEARLNAKLEQYDHFDEIWSLGLAAYEDLHK